MMPAASQIAKFQIHHFDIILTQVILSLVESLEHSASGLLWFLHIPGIFERGLVSFMAFLKLPKEVVVPRNDGGTTMIRQVFWET
jgi:hypothetical protein